MYYGELGEEAKDNQSTSKKHEKIQPSAVSAGGGRENGRRKGLCYVSKEKKGFQIEQKEVMVPKTIHRYVSTSSEGELRNTGKEKEVVYQGRNGTEERQGKRCGKDDQILDQNLPH